MGEKFAPCILNCPAHVDIRGYIDLIKKKDYPSALKLIMENLPLPGAIARICPHPCEMNCTRRFKDGAVNISQLRIFLSSIEKNFIPQIKNDSGKKIGIIGGGPAGICSAYFLRQMGHQIFIYDAMPKMGGMLRYGIPEYRLPKKILDKEMDFLSQMQINLINNFKVDKEKFLQMQHDFDAVIIAVGAWHSMKINCDGNQFFIDGIKFLQNIALDKENIVCGKKIAVVGGGNTAMDVCRSAIRLKAASVTNIYRRTKNEMPAQTCEIIEAQEEGVIFKELLSPVKIIDNGKNKTLIMQKYELGQKDSDGRFSFVSKNEFEQEDFDLIISAVSQKTEADFFNGKLNPDSTIKINNCFQTDNEKVFAIGDAIHTGKDRIAIVAISDAKKVSIAVNNFLMGLSVENLYAEPKKIICPSAKQKFESTRLEMKKVSVSERKNNFKEIILPWSEEEFLKEAMRCLNCGNHKK